MIKQEMPPREYLEKATKIIYATPESDSDGRITIKILGDWIDANENIMAMFLMFEPKEKVEETNSIFLPFKRHAGHLPILFEKYLSRRIYADKPIDQKTQLGSNSIQRMNSTISKTSDFMNMDSKNNFAVDNMVTMDVISEKLTKSKSSKIKKTIFNPSIDRLSNPTFKYLEKSGSQLNLPSIMQNTYKIEETKDNKIISLKYGNPDSITFQ
jgi:hypothetical protein